MMGAVNSFPVIIRKLRRIFTSKKHAVKKYIKGEVPLKPVFSERVMEVRDTSR
jgi:hypothetical protein